MKRVRQINNLVIYDRGTSYLPADRRYVVKAPTGKYLEEFSTAERAAHYCANTEDFVRRGQER